jgi:hypothetical protein
VLAIDPTPFRARALLAALALAAAAACGGKPKPATAPGPTSVRRAAVGDTIYVVEHTVRADRRAQFERFLQDTYWPAVRQVARFDTTVARVLRQTRVVYPLRANDDGTFSYLFLMDPVVPGETYNIRALLRRVYGDMDAERRYRELTDSWARPSTPFQSRAFVQPRYPTQP